MGSMMDAKMKVKGAQKAVSEMMAGNKSVTMDDVNGNLTLAVNAMNGMMMMMMGCVFLRIV